MESTQKSGGNSEEEQPRKKQDGRKGNGGNRKGTAPPGKLTAAQAAERLNIPISSFHYYVKQGAIPKWVPGYRKGLAKGNGYYVEEMINGMIGGEIVQHVMNKLEREAYQQQHEKPIYRSEVRLAEPEDAEGIVMVLRALGWPAATARQRRSWYKVNDRTDLIVTADVTLRELELGYKKGMVKKLLEAGRDGRIVTGYIWAAPFRPEILEDMMAGRKRAKNILPEHILPYTPGVYDLYSGIATLKGLEHSQTFGFRLLAGFLLLLEELREQGVLIRRLYAVSAEPDGQDLCNRLGFEHQPAEPGDLFPRYMLDLETSPAHFAALYREGIAKRVEGETQE